MLIQAHFRCCESVGLGALSGVNYFNADRRRGVERLSLSVNSAVSVAALMASAHPIKLAVVPRWIWSRPSP